MSAGARARPPLIVGIGGTIRERSSSEMALRHALAVARQRGAETVLIAGPSLVFPMYSPESAARDAELRTFIDALRRSDGIILSSPGYHGSISGLLKNAIDYVEDLRGDARPYFEGRPVGCIACAAGHQGAGTTLSALRDIVHALRGMPTPMGVTINTATRVFDDEGVCLDAGAARQLDVMAAQVVDFTGLNASSGQPAGAAALA
jgi:FMN reductase